MATPLRDVIQWLVTTLEADATLTGLGVEGAYSRVIPSFVEGPAIVIAKQTGFHNYVFGKEAHNRHWVSIKCVEPSEDDVNTGGDVARQVMDRVRELINLQRPTLTSGYTMIIMADNDYEYDEQEAGDNVYYHVGTVYRIQLGEL